MLFFAYIIFFKYIWIIDDYSHALRLLGPLTQWLNTVDPTKSI